MNRTAQEARKSYSHLGDFSNPDELGRALGESGYHASAHVRLGGVMAGFESPKDPSFYAWHGHIDKLIDEWLTTPKGQAWAKANPESPLLMEKMPDHHH